MKPYSTKVKIQPIYRETILHAKQLTPKGIVIEAGANAQEFTPNQEVYYNPDNNCFYKNHFYIDKEYILCV